MTVGGSTNTLAALKLALSDELCEAIYLLTDGRPDQVRIYKLYVTLKAICRFACIRLVVWKHHVVYYFKVSINLNLINFKRD